MANKIVSNMSVQDETIEVKKRGRPSKQICLWKDEEHKQNYFKKYFQESKAKLGKVTCDCGIEYFKVYEYKHKKTKCHQHFEEMVKKFSEKNI